MPRSSDRAAVADGAGAAEVASNERMQRLEPHQKAEIDPTPTARSRGDTPDRRRSRSCSRLRHALPRTVRAGGFLAEIGALRRDRDTLAQAGYEESRATKSTTYAGRAMIGWSWLFARHLFVTAAVGLSVGQETGTETVTTGHPILGPMPETTTTSLDRRQIDGEAYLRIGFALGR
jgi:hypothetical protein